MLALVEFEKDIRQNWALISKEQGNGNIKPKISSKQAYNIYQNTYTSPRDYIVLGPDQLRKQPELVKKWGLITFTSSHKPGNEGAILGEPQWSLLINDCFLLGAIHRKKRVFLHIEERDLKIETLWDQARGKLTTLGRELAILQKAGYRPITREIEGFTFSPSEVNPPPATLKELWKDLKEVDRATLEIFIKP